ncbi:MAG: glutaredoxin [Gammaproteobacteria bacterium]|jgi:glutaredoxin
MRLIDRCCIFALILSFVTAAAAAAGIHKWTDAEGRMHFGDRPPEGANSTTVEVKVNSYATPSIEGLAAVVGNREDKKRSKKSSSVILYSTSWCKVCVRAKQYFGDHEVSYKEYDIEQSDKGKKDFARLGGSGVPVILVGNRRLNGFSAASFEKIYSPR